VLVALSAALIVGLPAAGIGNIARGRVAGVAAGLLVWSWMVVGGFSLYFPGERVEALAAGAGVIAAPLRLAVDPAMVILMEQRLPSLVSSRVPPPRAETVLPPIVPLSLDGVPDGVVLPFEGQGRTMAIPVTFEGREESHERWMLFDTGATLTTLNARTLAELGLAVPADAPSVSLRTAAGQQAASVVFIERLWVGGLLVEGVTVAVCEACADDETVGLLGLNVSGRFRVTVDAAARTLVLQPREAPDHGVDLSPWLSVEATAVHWSDGRIEVELSVESQIDRTVSEVTIEIRCEQTFAAQLREIPPKGRAEATVSLPLGVSCDGYSVAMTEGRW
jgi:clan AA aspartic protease (TIGR02281 family)